MKWQVSHRTIYGYDDEVSDSYAVAYVTPRELASQRVIEHQLTVDPVPADLSTDIDLYGNTVTYFQVTERHRTLDVHSLATVEVTERVHDPAMLNLPWESCRPAERSDAPDAWRALDFALPSRLVTLTDGAFAYGAESLTPGRPIGEAMTDLMHRIYTDFKYRSGVTTVSSTIDDLFDKREGVCQDFAHLLLACLRSHGLAGRYASGYLATMPPPGKEHVFGADASHAWGAVWLPDGTWLAVDPTNDQWVNERYVVVAFGRDFGDVSPLKGVIFTEAKKSTLKVEVDVVTVD